MMNQPKLVAIILTKDERDHIAESIESLIEWVDKVVIFDSAVDDEVCRLAEAAGATVIRHSFENFAAQRQAALDAVDAEWILFLDADERATPTFGDEVLKKIQAAGPANEAHNEARNEAHAVGYWLPRRNFIIGKEIRHGGYYPDYQLRLLRRESARYVPEREVHEIVNLDGPEGHLQTPIIHYNYSDWSQFHQKQRFYSAYEARILDGRGIRPRPHNFVLQPLREFIRRYISLQGWKDGWRGFQLALLFAWYYGFMPYWILRMKKNEKHADSSNR